MAFDFLLDVHGGHFRVPSLAFDQALFRRSLVTGGSWCGPVTLVIRMVKTSTELIDFSGPNHPSHHSYASRCFFEAPCVQQVRATSSR